MPRRQQHRGPTPTTYIPPVRQDDVALILDYLMTTYGSLRPPTVQAHAAAVAVELHRRGGLEFPSRQALAAWIGCTKDGLSDALDALIERDLLELVIQTRPSGVRPGSRVQTRHYVPTKELLRVFVGRKAA